MALTPVLFPSAGQFGDIRTVSKTPLIELSSTFPISILRDIVTTTGSGTVTSANSEIQLNTTANVTDTAVISSADRGRYKPGYSAEAGIGARIPVAPTGSQIARWGYFDENNGIYFGVDAAGIFIGRRRGGSDTITRQADWNVDRLDGTGDSTLTLDLARGNIFQITFTWYGYGVIEYSVVMLDAQNRQRVYPIHRTGVTGSTSINEPNLPLRAEIDNGGTASAFDFYLGGRQFSVVGKYSPNERTTSIQRLNVANIGTSSTPIFSIRKKTGFFNVPVYLSGVDIIASGDAVLEAYLGSSITGASYGAIPNIMPAETSLELSTAQSAFSGGTMLFSTLVSATGTGNSRTGSQSMVGLSKIIPESQPILIAVKSLTGTVTCNIIARFSEDW